MLVNAKNMPPPYLQRRHALAGLMARPGMRNLEGPDGSIDGSIDESIDWSPWYLTEEEDMGQSPEQDAIVHVLMSSLEVLSEERGWQSVMVGNDQFFAWVEGEPLVQVSPDIFLLDDPPLPGQPLPRRWETWRPGCKPPRFAVEIVSEDWKKDYAINPARYDHLGVSELVIADADAWFGELGHRGRAPLSVYRRSREDRLELVYQGRGPAFSREIDAYLCFKQPAAHRILLRISRSADGQDLVPTALEKAQAAKQEATAAKQEATAAKQEATAAKQEATAAKQEATAAKQEAIAAEAKAKAMEAELLALRALLQKPPGS